MHNCRKSDVEITCVSTSTQTECCEIFDRTWRKGAETRRCFIVHTQLTVMPGSMCCTGTGATMAMGFALQVQFMFRVQTMLATLFIVYCSASAFPHFYSVTGPTLAVGALLLEQAHWFSELWLQPMLAASDLCPLLGVGEARTASSGQNPTCKSAQTLVFMQQDMYLGYRYYVSKSDCVCKILTHSYCDDLWSSLISI